jgi:hypothetical protein
MRRGGQPVMVPPAGADTDPALLQDLLAMLKGYAQSHVAPALRAAQQLRHTYGAPVKESTHVLRRDSHTEDCWCACVCLCVYMCVCVFVCVWM